MGFFLLVLLTSIGGSFGGLASAIAQKHKGKTEDYGLLKHAFFGSEKMITGSAASICMFFFLGSLFNLEPVSLKKNFTSKNTEQDITAEFILPLREEPIVFTKILSFSVAAGFAGVPLMETVSKQLQSRLSDDEDEDQKKSTSRIKTIKTIDTQAVEVGRQKSLPSEHK